ncbi:hypothetical protein [Nonomuraea jiangxiensis]|uniref:Glycosyl hydrolase catalytic core n=1 Tax=Nonomuraea jiangxiensis TaxID=633440 RepID=A0A1G8MEC6_9ACTN|nr:hypothetical protein [Nonomuraea jiangxiensis]SDI66232.1 hypothetical protein SAMN05421869_106387 [Nonomuraea jiangxiensis]
MTRRGALLAVAVLAIAALLWFVPRGLADPPAATPPATPRPSGPTQPAELGRVPWEGGPAYYAKFPATAAAGWTKDSFFPIGVWYESVITQDDVDKDRAAGINTYVELTETSDMALIRNNGMFAIPSKPLPGHGAETVAWLITDEADMWAGPGDDGWTGNFPGQGPLCIPDDPHKERCGYTVMKTLKERLPKGDGRPHYANYGKGVMIWQNDAQAGRFVNDYTDLVSLDVYWYTSHYACQDAEGWLNIPQEQCRLSANYGSLLDRQRKLDAADGERQPIYAFVEVGWPAPEDTRGIEPEQVKGAVMNSIIHEARGVIYFNHSFGGPCQTQHALRDACGARTRPAVTEVNAQLRQLAPVLNTQSLDYYSFGQGLDTMLKEHQGSYYVFAMLKRGVQPGVRSFRLPGGLSPSKVEVLFENREVPVSGGSFSDSFAKEYSYHIYKITP